jgi:hypothetical protein
MAGCLEKDHHFAAAVERMPCVLFVYQVTEQEVTFIDQPGLLLCVDRRAGNSRQDALPDY